jgi:dipeptidyl aminopeptidase/acylaminoacyl peptidase
MTKKTIRSYGSWPSEITGEKLVQSSLRLGQIQVSGGQVFWTEGRPEEKGRTALMSWRKGDDIRELSPSDGDIRTRTHEYGGGAFLASSQRHFVILNKDQQIHELMDGKIVKQITHDPDCRYADLCLDLERNRIYAIEEDHSDPHHVKNAIVAIALDGSGSSVRLVQGHDFFSNPRLSPDGSRLAFLQWDHPNMPWDGTELCLAEMTPAGDIGRIEKIAGGPEESIFQPEWDPSAVLYFVSDRSGWWNLYAHSHGSDRCLWELEAEFGLPQWVFGMSTYTVLAPGRIAVTHRSEGRSTLSILDVGSGAHQEILTPYPVLDQLRGEGDLLAFVGSAVDKPAEIVCLDLATETHHILRPSGKHELAPTLISTAQPIQFEVREGESCFAWYYPPTSDRFDGPGSEAPPLIVLSHGGPTSFSSNAFSLAIQYWTSRGFAIADVNYSGSTGYGRAYRQRLNGTWGIRDVEDCCAAAAYLVSQHLADPQRLIIKGGSAGGYTTLAALTFKDVFNAGASYYGVGDLEMLAKDTHKFESRYLDKLVGEYPAEAERYRARSPIHHTQDLNCPVIFLQGLDDPVVPPNQAETMVNALKEKGIPVAYVPFEGESHGFRQARTIIKAIESEYAFYCRIFGLDVSEELATIKIWNL